MILHSREVSFLPGSAFVSSYVGFELIMLEGTKVVGVFGRTSGTPAAFLSSATIESVKKERAARYR